MMPLDRLLAPGDDTGLLRAMARKIALPALIERAKRQLAPLALADLETRYAAAEAERVRLHEQLEAKKSALHQAQAEHAAAVGAIQDCDARRHELSKQRNRAQQRVAFYESHPEGLPTSEERGVVVRSIWQQAAEVHP